MTELLFGLIAGAGITAGIFGYLQLRLLDQIRVLKEKK